MAPQNPRDMREYLRTLERLTTQQRAMPAMVSNTLKIIKEEVREEKIRHPAAPIELAPETALYFDNRHRRQRARVLVDFPDVVFNTDGTPATIHQYELWGREVTVSTLFTTTSAVPSQAAPGLTLPGLAATASNEVIAETETPWLVEATSAESLFQADGYAPGSVWMFRVRALGEGAIQPGEWSEEITVQMLENTVPPPQPTAPVVEASRGQLIVTWDGLSVDGAMPADFSYAILAHGTDSSPTFEVAQFGRGGGIHVLTGAAYYDPQFFRLCAVDNSGNVSAWSEQADGFTTPLVDVDIILSEIDAAKTQITNAGQILLAEGVLLNEKLAENDLALADAELALTGPGGLTERLADAEQMLQDVGAVDTAELTRQLTENTTAIDLAKTDLTKLADRVSPLEAGLTLVETALPSMQLSINGKSAIYREAVPPVNDPSLHRLGDRYEWWSTLASGGQLLNTYRHDGTGWITEVLAASYLPLVDIGAGTFGTLNGSRLTAKSVSADAITVGDFTNYALGSDFESPAHPWTMIGGAWVVSDIRAHTGTYSLRHPAGNTAVAIAQLNAEIPVKEGDSIYCSFWVWRSTDWNGAGNSKIRFGNATNDNANLGGPSFAFDAVPGPAGGGSGWVQVESTFIVPAGVTRLGVDIRTDNTIGQIHIDEIEIRRMDAGKLVVAGSITGDHIAAESVAAKVGSFLTLGVDQLTVADTANLKTAVADRLFANIFATNKLTTNQLWVGSGGNLFPYPLDHERWTHPPLVTFSATGGRNGGPTQTVQATTEQYGAWFGNTEPDRAQYGPHVTPGESYRVSFWVRSATAIPANSIRGFMRLYAPGSNTIVNPSSTYLNNTTALAANTWHLIEGIVEIPLGPATIMSIGLYTTANANIALTFSDLAIQLAATPSLIVEGGILAKHITASEEMSAKVGQFLKLDVGNLVANTANLQTAVADRLFANIFSTNKLTANQMVVGKGENLIPWFGNAVAAQRTWDPHLAIRAGVVFKSENTGGRSGGPHAVMQDESLATEGDVAVFRFMSGRTAKDGWVGNYDVEPGQKYLFSMWTKSGGTYTLGAPRVRMQALFYRADGTNTSLNPAGHVISGTWTELRAEYVAPSDAVSMTLRFVMSKPGHVHIEDPSLVKDGASLIATGGIVTSHLKVTEDMTVALLKAHKVLASEINVNNLAADTAFVGALDAKLVVSDMFKGKTFEGGTFTGTLFQSSSSANRGVKLDSTGLNAWDSTGKKFLTVGLNGVNAVGSFVAEDDTSAITMGSTADTFDRPGLSFTIKGRSGLMPKIFAEAGGGGSNGAYPAGSLVIVGTEATANSTGRGELSLEPNGGAGRFTVAYGTNAYTGFHWENEYATVIGKFNKAFNAKSQIRYGIGGAGMIPAGSYQEWTFTHSSPPPNGVLTPISIVPEAVPGVGQVLGVSVNNISRTGFRARVSCSGVANTSAQVPQLAWWAMWTS